MSALPSNVAPFRGPPAAIESEQSVLGILLADPAALSAVKLTEADFLRADHRLIFAAICDEVAAGRECDAILLGDVLLARGHGDRVRPEYLVELQTLGWRRANLRAYVEQVRQKSVLRAVIGVGERLTDAASESEHPEALLDTAIRELMALAQTDRRYDYSLADAARMAFADAIEASENPGMIRGVPTGYERIDKRLGGLHKGDLVLLGARPSMGKTALMVNLALNAAESGVFVGIISGEQSAMQLGQRSVSAMSGVAAERMRNGEFEDEDWPRLTAGTQALLARKARIYDRSAPTLDEVCRVARQWVHEHKIGVLFVDYLQRIRVPRAENRIAEVSEVARTLKTLARDLNIPIVALAQVKAEVDNRAGDKRPNLGDIANSDEATREADQIGFLYRDEVYRDDSPDRGIAELNFEKNRHGPTGRFKLRFDGATMRFQNLAGGYA